MLIWKPHVPGASLEWKRKAFLPQASWLPALLLHALLSRALRLGCSGIQRYLTRAILSYKEAQPYVLILVSAVQAGVGLTV